MLSVITINEPEKWDNIVKTFKNYDVYYLSGYVKAFELHGDGQPILFFYEDNDIRAMNVSMKRDIAENIHFKDFIPQNTFFDLATPYGYGGFLVEGSYSPEDIKKLNEEYVKLCNENSIVCEFVRFNPLTSNANNANYIYDETVLGKTVSMDLNSTKIIWDNLTSKNRNVIRKAKKNEVEIYWGRDKNLYDTFIKMYNSTMDKDNATSYYYFNKDFYKSILNDLKYNSIMFYAVYANKIIAMSIILFANCRMHYHLSASIDEYKHLAPTNLLLYEVACWGSEQGFLHFHLGGGVGSSEDSLYKFKNSFNRNSDNKFVVGKKILDKEKYDWLVSLRKFTDEENNKENFFPKYRIQINI